MAQPGSHDARRSAQRGPSFPTLINSTPVFQALGIPRLVGPLPPSPLHKLAARSPPRKSSAKAARARLQCSSTPPFLSRSMECVAPVLGTAQSPLSYLAQPGIFAVDSSLFARRQSRDLPMLGSLGPAASLADRLDDVGNEAFLHHPDVLAVVTFFGADDRLPSELDKALSITCPPHRSHGAVRRSQT
ncbi:hypothetical protein BCR44DRAFT_1426388 [Catenaria anguillulae PL171]|uniref:Uncharacterized protein n=1 Tax=Catenaria anguillulae PL171 TaxID=765915 RepID=A0A1Y2HXX2_9FUNG|nr:hypothetical protein BCR44DRAFT_1426388 [Catenaria anguillulae PL171]